MKEKIAKIIRTVTIPPMEAFVMLLILYHTKKIYFGNLRNLIFVILFLMIIPICAYPIASKIKKKGSTRDHQRKMAFLFNFLSYLMIMLIGYGLGFSKNLQWILNIYFLSVLVLTVINKGFKIKASGHACSCVLPYLILSSFFGTYVAVLCFVLYLLEFWASIELKRHTVKEFFLGSMVAVMIFIASLIR